MTYLDHRNKGGNVGAVFADLVKEPGLEMEIGFKSLLPGDTCKDRQREINVTPKVWCRLRVIPQPHLFISKPYLKYSKVALCLSSFKSKNAKKTLKNKNY